MLGPNGAGKTTAVRILATLLAPDAGSARVGGLDVVRDSVKVRRQIGLTGQYASVDEGLTGTENLVLIGRLLDLPRREARARAKELLASFDLTEAADKPAKHYSGGMRRRLDLAASLVGRPAVMYLDEPTTGLDPSKREDMWQLVRDLVADGTTVLLTTQYLDEADALADEICVIDHGKVIATGTPDELKHVVGGQTIEVRPSAPRRSRLPSSGILARHRHRADRIAWPRRDQRPGRGRCGPCRRRPSGWPPRASPIAEFSLRLPSLDEVFFSLTGRHEPSAARP